jgi:Tol biopolymer transport system component
MFASIIRKPHDKGNKVRSFVTSFIAFCLAALPASANYVDNVGQIAKNGGRVDWLSGGPIAFDRSVNDQFEIYTMQPDGKNIQCITCSNDKIKGGDRSNPAWHPNGKYLVIQVEKPGRKSPPGFGHGNDLWLISFDGKNASPLTNLPDTPDTGVLHPHFSADGKRLVWSQMRQKPHVLDKSKEYGLWSLCVADFAIDDNGPTLTNIRTLEPMGPAFYESHGFNADGSKLIFSSNAKSGKPLFMDNDIYSLDIASGAVTRLTTEGYNEHAECSPDGKKIVWMSTNENVNKGTDLWIMNPDGTEKERLTNFNQPGKKKLVAADSSWSGDGGSIVCYVQDNLLKQTGTIYLIKLKQHF